MYRGFYAVKTQKVKADVCAILPAKIDLISSQKFAVLLSKRVSTKPDFCPEHFTLFINLV